MKYVVYYRNSYAASEPIRYDSEYTTEQEAQERAEELNEISHPAWVEKEN